MKFLFDQSTDRRLAPYLRRWGHDVTVVAVDYPPSLPDNEVLAIAQGQQRILITEDRDFGDLVFRHQQADTGAIYLRLPPMELSDKIVHLQTLLQDHSSDLDQFVVVTERSVRVRRTQQP